MNALDDLPACSLSERAGPRSRRGETTWQQFLTRQGEYILSWDFFTVETAFLRWIYVLFSDRAR